MKFVPAYAVCCLGLALFCVTECGAGTPLSASHRNVGAQGSGSVDISRDVTDTTIERLPTPSALGEWEYSRALFLLGELSVYQRTHDPKYLAYARAWADSHIRPDGSIDRPIDALDFIMPGNVAITLYQLTGEPRYKLAADRLAGTFEGYPRTSDGAWWHAIDSGREHQLWLDGTYMALPFLVRQGELSGRPEKARAEAVRQLLLYGKNLRDAHGPLYFHAYDESGKSDWANPVTHQSSLKWGRAIGWYCMALVNVLNAMPSEPPTANEREQRRELIAIVQKMARDLVRFQDPNTGLWFQIVDQPKLAGNFVETSSSSMFTYFLDVAVKHRYIASSYRGAAQRGYNGVLSQVVKGPDGHFHVQGICEGTNVGATAYYLSRKVNTDDFHGLGAFLLMNEEVKYNRSIMDPVQR